MSEDEMAGRHHQCNGHELGQTLGDGEGQGLMYYSPWQLQTAGHDWATEQQHQIMYSSVNCIGSMFTFRVENSVNKIS